jgi:transglutaminase-like putative cysteine protease
MKKIVSFLLFFCVLISLTGCADNELITKIKSFNVFEYLSDNTDWTNTQVEELSEGSPHKYYFNRLGNKEKQAYNNILTEIEAMPATIEIPSLTQTELNSVFEALLYDNPYLFFLDRSCTITTRGVKSYFNAEYVMSTAEYAEKKRVLEGIADEIIASIGTREPFETELFIHDYIIDNSRYAFSGTANESNAYGVLVENSAACEGYAKAAKLLLDLAGIECYVISGMARNYQDSYESHMWNIVKINGDYYHLDTTWDDPVTLGKEDISDPIYTYFNITDSEIKKTHKDFSTLNACTATAENYFVKRNLFFTGYNDSTKNSIAVGIAAAADAGRSSLEIKFGSSSVYQKALKELFKNQQIYDVLSQASRLTGKSIKDTAVSYIPKDNFAIIEIVFELR